MARRANPLKGKRLAPEAQRWLYDPGPALRRLDWAAIFGRQAPVELEVGCGKGLFLLQAAQADPAADFIGVEMARPYALLAAHRLAQHALANARVICMDARVLLAHYVADASLRRIHVLFPDPWWKKRHRKRRVFTPEFVGHCARTLQPGGEVHIATDVEAYYDDIRALFAAEGTLRPLEPRPAADSAGRTHYERRMRQAGQPVFCLRYVRNQPGAPATPAELGPDCRGQPITDP